MKAYLSIGLSFALGCLTGCGGDNTSSESPAKGEATADTTETAVEEGGESTETDDTASSETGEDAENGESPSEGPFQLTGLEPGQLIAVEPGGDTVCSRGTPFRFFVRGGSVNKVIVDFAGGGACWDSLTCSVADAIFNAEAPSLEQIEAGIAENKLAGIYDYDNPENPFKDWFMIHIPYCTGDIHWGNATHEYTETLSIEHKGYLNSRAALDYLEENFPSVEEVFVSGCSAGAYGAILHSGSISDAYPDAKMTVLGDSGAGIITDDWFADSFPNWNAEAALPDWFVLPGGSVLGLSIVDVYAEMANHYPEARFAQYSTAYDSNQEFYFTAMGGAEEEWSGRLLQNLTDIRARAENFTYYVTPGEVHCVTPYALLYEPPATGPAVSDWMTSLRDGDSLPEPIQCEGEACDEDTWCAVCATESAPHCNHCVSQ